jgi:surface polysaccharide O-acyltransferase-like enzyme
MKKLEQNFNWADNLRFVAIFGVIVLHATPNMLYYKGEVSESLWWTANIITSLFRFCVPVFVMLTGALVLTKDYELGYFVKKKFFRVVLPFLFWSIGYICYDLFLYHDKVTMLYVVRFSIDKLIHGASFHLWYVYMIIGLYMFIPVLRKWYKNASEKELIYFILIWFIVLCFNLPVLNKFSMPSIFKYFSGYIGYLVLGAYLSEKRIHDKIQTNIISISLILLGLFVIIIGTRYYFLQKNIFRDDLYGYLTPFVLDII